jgi:AraC family transcriptional regulator of adaptative response/methylated-DNA-[protein]-cysteine methyltransferase
MIARIGFHGVFHTGTFDKKNKMTADEIDYGRIEKALVYINDHFQSQPTLEEVAGQVHLSPYHFQRMFTQWAGISPKKYLQFISTGFAKSLLKGGDFTISEVTHATGLSGTSRLHDHFVQLEAMTPGQYKSGGKDLKIAYGFYDSPFGELLLARTSRGICRIEFVSKETLAGNRNVFFRNSALEKVQSEWPNAEFEIDQADAQKLVDKIFNPEMTKSDESIKLHLKGTPFQIKVWEALLNIPFGETGTYQQVASAIQNPGASRAVGSAIGSNPVAFLIPCHRIIRQSGGLSGYRWSPERKLSILNWEQCHIFHAHQKAS